MFHLPSSSGAGGGTPSKAFGGDAAPSSPGNSQLRSFVETMLSSPQARPLSDLDKMPSSMYVNVTLLVP